MITLAYILSGLSLLMSLLFLVPIGGTLKHYAKLLESGVPAINVVFPWTEHAFDLLFPKLSPPAQSALYHVDRFLALLLNKY